jgi:NAD(P)-dependent dehydrogenase (short-subunit alcohol dehydrogenase family)
VTQQKTIVITGASSGLGAVATGELARDGWDVAVVGRNPDRTRAVADRVGASAFVCDYDHLDEVRALANALLTKYPTIDVLANNAGGLVSRRGDSADGFERTFQHNHLAPFLLTNLLLERLEASQARVINTASVANTSGRVNLADLNSRRGPYLFGWRAYATSKLETILFTRELARRTGLTAYSFHPGFVATAFGTDSALGRAAMRMARSAQITPEAGAAPLVQLATSDVLDVPNGTYFDGLRPHGRTARQGDDTELATALWEADARMVGLG